MDNTRLPKHAVNYKPRGRRDHGRPKKRWQCVDAGTGQTNLSMEEDDDDDDDVKYTVRFFDKKKTKKWGKFWFLRDKN